MFAAQTKVVYGLYINLESPKGSNQSWKKLKHRKKERETDVKKQLGCGHWDKGKGKSGSLFIRRSKEVGSLEVHDGGRGNLGEWGD